MSFPTTDSPGELQALIKSGVSWSGPVTTLEQTNPDVALHIVPYNRYQEVQAEAGHLIEHRYPLTPNDKGEIKYQITCFSLI